MYMGRVALVLFVTALHQPMLTKAKNTCLA